MRFAHDIRADRAVEAAEIWSGRPEVFGCPGALGRYLAGTGWQFGADLAGEVQVCLAAGQLLQASGDERGGLGDVTAALRDPRAQEVEFGAGERRAGGEPVQQCRMPSSRTITPSRGPRGYPEPARSHARTISRLGDRTSARLVIVMPPDAAEDATSSWTRQVSAQRVIRSGGCRVAAWIPLAGMSVACRTVPLHSGG
jgi:hypothetical protein